MTVLAFYFIVLSAITLSLPLISHATGATHLVSLRTIVLFSFFWYQTWNPVPALLSGDLAMYPIQDPIGSGWTFALGCTAWLFTFALAYRYATPLRDLGQRFPKPKKIPGETVLMIIAVVLVVIGSSLRLTDNVAAGILSLFFGISFINAAVAISGWVLARKPGNPVLVSLVVGVSLLAVVVSMTGFGRRPLLGVLAAFGFGFFFSRLRDQPIIKAAIILLVASYPLLLTLNAFSALRSPEYLGMSGVEKAFGVATYFLDGGVEAYIPGAGFNRSPEFEGAMFVIENYPEMFSHSPFFGIWYTFGNTVPRSIWPDKPVHVSTRLAAQADVRGVDQQAITLSIGVVGEAFAEDMRWIAVFAYAIFIGMFVRFFDSILESGRSNVWVVAAICINLGQFFGLCRGAVPVFLNIYLVGFFATYPVLMIASKCFGYMPWVPDGEASPAAPDGTDGTDGTDANNEPLVPDHDDDRRGARQDFGCLGGDAQWSEDYGTTASP